MPENDDSPLLAEIKRRIAFDGPMTIATYMALCLGHPQHGYYVTRDPLGADGDFTTAPEISQMFGELIGLWCAEVWQGLGAPETLHLIELGPGRGTLMADALRATRQVPGFHAALQVAMVETSPPLQCLQQDALAGSPVPVQWHSALDSVAAGPSLIIANEFLDALPIRQFVRGERQWHERLIGLDDAGALSFGLSGEVSAITLPAPVGTVMEISPAQEFLIRDAVAPRLRDHPGAALFIDYGSIEAATGDSFQALHRHAKVSPLFRPGETDLTAHAPFATLGELARNEGLTVHGMTNQRDFLGRLGIGLRAEALYRAAADDAARLAVETAFQRLTDDSPSGMGGLFKVLALSSPSILRLPGLPGPGQPESKTS